MNRIMRWFLIRLRTHCMFVIFRIRQICKSSCELSLRVFSIFDRVEFMTSLLRMRLMRSRVFVTKYSYEYNENFILTIHTRIDWFFRLDVLDTIYDEEVVHCRMSKSIYSRWLSIVAFKAILRNRLIQINF